MQVHRPFLNNETDTMNPSTPSLSLPTWHKSACNLCYINCGVELAVAGQGADARVVKVRGDR